MPHLARAGPPTRTAPAADPMPLRTHPNSIERAGCLAALQRPDGTTAKRLRPLFKGRNVPRTGTVSCRCHHLGHVVRAFCTGLYNHADQHFLDRISTHSSGCRIQRGLAKRVLLDKQMKNIRLVARFVQVGTKNNRNLSCGTGVKRVVRNGCQSCGRERRKRGSAKAQAAPPERSGIRRSEFANCVVPSRSQEPSVSHRADDLNDLPRRKRILPDSAAP